MQAPSYLIHTWEKRPVMSGIDSHELQEIMEMPVAKKVVAVSMALGVFHAQTGMGKRQVCDLGAISYPQFWEIKLKHFKEKIDEWASEDLLQGVIKDQVRYLSAMSKELVKSGRLSSHSKVLKSPFHLLELGLQLGELKAVIQKKGYPHQMAISNLMPPVARQELLEEINLLQEGIGEIRKELVHLQAAASLDGLSSYIETEIIHLIDRSVHLTTYLDLLREEIQLIYLQDKLEFLAKMGSCLKMSKIWVKGTKFNSEMQGNLPLSSEDFHLLSIDLNQLKEKMSRICRQKECCFFTFHLKNRKALMEEVGNLSIQFKLSQSNVRYQLENFAEEKNQLFSIQDYIDLNKKLKQLNHVLKFNQDAFDIDSLIFELEQSLNGIRKEEEEKVDGSYRCYAKFCFYVFELKKRFLKLLRDNQCLNGVSLEDLEGLILHLENVKSAQQLHDWMQMIELYPIFSIEELTMRIMDLSRYALTPWQLETLEAACKRNAWKHQVTLINPSEAGGDSGPIGRAFEKY